MKRRVVLSVVAVLLAACGSSAAHSAGTTSAPASPAGDASRAAAVVCGPSGAKTLASSSQARVYLSHGQVFGCAHGASRSFLLGQRMSCLGGRARIAPVAVTGVLAGYGSERCGVDTGASTVVVQRLSEDR